jgi:hypothetical protein
MAPTEDLARQLLKRAISQKQLEANRRNAQKSTGPRTEAGKERSRLNAFRHHITGQVSTMTDPDQAAHEKFCKSIIAAWNPEGAMELQLAMSIATDQWRLNRASAIEENIFALGVSNTCNASIMPPEAHPEIEDAMQQARVFTLEAKNLQLLTLYQQRIHRTMQKNIALLKEMQEEREAKRAAEMEEAKRLLQLSEMRNIPYEPTKDGFVFSNDEIYSAIDKTRRLQRAAQTDFSHFQRRKFRPQHAPPAVTAAPQAA